MRQKKKMLSIILTFILTFMMLLNNITVQAAQKQVIVPNVDYIKAPILEYTAGDIVNFDLHAPNYGGRVQYRVLLWDDNKKEARDLWTIGDGYYTNWMPYGNNKFNLHWKIDEPGSYRITVYVKRAGIANKNTYLKGDNCDSYMESQAFVVNAKTLAFDKNGQTYGSTDENKIEAYNNDINITGKDVTFNNAKLEGTLTVTGDNAVIRNVNIVGNIVVDPGKDGSCTLENVTAKDIKVLSGGQNSIHIRNSNIGTMNVNSENPIRIEVDGDTEIVSTSASGYVIFDRKNGTYGTITITKDENGESVIEFRGDIQDKIEVEAAATIKTGQGSSIANLVINTKSNTDVVKLEGQYGRVDISSNTKLEVGANTKIENIISNNDAEIKLDKLSSVTSIEKGDNNVIITGEGIIGVGDEYEYVPPRVAVNAINVTTDDQPLAVGATLQLTTILTPTNATNKNVDWTSSNDEIAKISASGLVTGISVGEAIIKVTTADGGKMDNVLITVVSAIGGTVTINGTTKFGEVLTANIEAITYEPTTHGDVPTYRWKRNGLDIEGATGTAYTLAEADISKTITVTAIADGINATGSVTSVGAGTVEKADAAEPDAPALNSKTETSVTLVPNDKQEFSNDNGMNWQTSNSFTGLSILTEYTFKARVKETATHKASGASAGTVIKTDGPVIGGIVIINGTAKFGEVLTANIEAITYEPTTHGDVPTYQWKRNGLDIEGATGTAYTLTEADISKTITVAAIADGINATGSVTSVGAGTVEKADAAEPDAPALNSKTETSVTLVPNDKQEFSNDNGMNWQTSNSFTGLSILTEYIFKARVKETATHKASGASAGTVIKTDGPVIGGIVTINGTTKFGEVLTANIEAITYEPTTHGDVPTYQWKRNGLDIEEATGAVYTLAEADISKTITVTAIADGINATGSVTSAGSGTVVKADAATPYAPALYSKTATSITLVQSDLQEFSKDDGENWQISNSFTGLSAITEYTFKARVMETATHKASGASAGTIIKTNAPVMGGIVTINGTAKFGEVLTANIEAITYEPTTHGDAPTYQWKRNGLDIEGATGTAYTLAEADISKTITVTAIADGINATGSVTSAGAGTVEKANAAAPDAPVLNSKSATKIILAANVMNEFSINGGPWQDSEVFKGLTPLTEYTFISRVKETATHTASAASAGVSITTNDTSVMGGVLTIEGDPKFGSILTTNITGLTYSPVTEDNLPTFQWKRNGSNIEGATGAVYILAEADIGQTIMVTAAGDGINATGSVTSAATGTVTKADGPAAPIQDIRATFTIEATTIDLKKLGESTKGFEAAVAIDGVSYTPYFNLNVSSTGEVRISGLTSVTASAKVKIRVKETSTAFAGADKEITAVEAGVGDRGPAGGYIFYNKGSYSDGWRYIEAATIDTSTAMWGYTEIYNGGTSEAIGSGKANTQSIISQIGHTTSTAKLCDDLVLGGKDDWFEPSRDELHMMYTNLRQNGLGGFGDFFYWSSSEQPPLSYSGKATAEFFGGGLRYYYQKRVLYNTRAARYF